MAFLPRKISDTILRLSVQFPVLFLTGPRQSGKTTLLKNLFGEEYHYANLEDLSTRQLAQQDREAFFQLIGTRAIIDEAQRVPELFSAIQVKVDDNPGLRYVLSGSQNFLLLEQVSQSLAGRAAVLKLLPMSMPELKQSNSLAQSPEEVIWKGGYPRLFTPELDPVTFYDSYITTYIERDVRTVENITNLRAFQHFVGLCAGHTGQLLNYQNLANDAGVSLNTIKSWLGVLDAGYIAFTLPPFFRNFNKRLRKSLKLYFYDTGVACSLLRIEKPDDLLRHHMRGALFENFVVLEAIKKQYNSARRSNAYFWRESNGTEVDLVLDKGTHLKAMEIKSGKTWDMEYFNALRKWQKISGTPPEECLVIYAGDENVKTKYGQLMSWRKLDEMNF